MNNINNINNNYFFCYSPNLYREIKHNNNIQYITKGTNPSSGKNFWVFEKTNELKHILDNWSYNKQLNIN